MGSASASCSRSLKVLERESEEMCRHVAQMKRAAFCRLPSAECSTTVAAKLTCAKGRRGAVCEKFHQSPGGPEPVIHNFLLSPSDLAHLAPIDLKRRLGLYLHIMGGHSCLDLFVKFHNVVGEQL